MQSFDEKNQRIRQLENENRMLQEKVSLLEHNVEILTQAVLHASKQRFGASSEKTPLIYGQCFLFGELIDEFSDKTENKVINIKEHKRPVRKKGDRENLIKALSHEVIECVLNAEEAICKICGSELKIIGKKKVRSEMEYIPAKLVMKDYVQYVYKCIECGKNDTNPYDSISCAPVPAPVLSHSFASPSCMAWVMYQKYMMSVPLYRQEKDFKRMGAELKRDMMANWVIRSSEYWLMPLYEKMHEQLLKCGVIMSDETTWQVNHEDGKKASSKSYIWIHRSGNCEGPPIILYKYTSSRSGDHAKKFLGGFHGYHVSDAYAGYEKVEGITRCLCFSHLRRYYLEAIPLDSGKKEILGSGGAIGRAYCDKLFRLERKWKELSPEERGKNRLIYSVPVLDAFFVWAENTFTNQENLKKALGYTLNHKKYFTNFLLDGRIPLSNNLSEIAVKPVAITRKNSLFSDSPEGAEASATVFSIINTAAANNLDAYKYLEYLFRKLPNSNFASNSSVLDKYLPWADKVQLECRINTTEISKKEEPCSESA
ncbi:IS66 family transposase [Clostridium tagluense]|uniref:IS66 family transposase n=1 Tax=Clostridium tagluense TaxID=360422 RepID=UPI001CF201B2|nr:IS66 family transposase [Clostridium tagluense]MCB2314310.1 IS66 family transposase [Clostridium tagluense]MCB2319162.1 IS66 family transposase [Clostridium tagluense]MCB2324056.1 IS66 family transposase [Clostridium tagluense]MCB2328904.1 IS66 family transposase [Clostridium tagluense]MCB2333760.1 IS66 family transposase [Clostridium tagluense]